MPKILLIRHGESQSNAGMKTSDPKKIELSPRGFQQADDVAKEIRKSYTSLGLIIISPYLRAKQTASPTQKLFPSVPTEEWQVQEFTYLSSWSNINSTTEDRRFWVNVYWNISEPSFIESPESESFEHFIERAQEVIIRLKNTRYETMALFSHEQFICALLWLSKGDTIELSSETMKDYKDFLASNPIPNGAIVRVQFRDSQDCWQYELTTSHLNNPETVAMGS